MTALPWIAVGGAAGALLRYALHVGLTRSSSALPWGTLAANVIGCFAIGILATLLAQWTLRDEHRLALTVGLLGGLTTFSTFAHESVLLHQGAGMMRALGYVILTNVLAVGAAAAGVLVAVRFR